MADELTIEEIDRALAICESAFAHADKVSVRIFVDPESWTVEWERATPRRGTEFLEFPPTPQGHTDAGYVAAAIAGYPGALRELKRRKTPVRPEKPTGFVSGYGKCGRCKSVVNHSMSFCPNCGTPIDWTLAAMAAVERER